MIGTILGDAVTVDGGDEIVFGGDLVSIAVPNIGLPTAASIAWFLRRA